MICVFKALYIIIQSGHYQIDRQLLPYKQLKFLYKTAHLCRISDFIYSYKQSFAPLIQFNQYLFQGCVKRADRCRVIYIYSYPEFRQIKFIAEKSCQKGNLIIDIAYHVLNDIPFRLYSDYYPFIITAKLPLNRGQRDRLTCSAYSCKLICLSLYFIDGYIIYNIFYQDISAYIRKFPLNR